MARHDNDPILRTSGFLLGGLLVGAAIILFAIFAGGFDLGLGSAPHVRIDATPNG